MILKEPHADLEFKAQFAACVTEDELRLDDLLTLLKQQDYGILGTAFLLLSQGQIETAKLEVRRGYQAATDSDEAALFALSCVLDLLPTTHHGLIRFEDLPPEHLLERAHLFNHLNELVPGKFSLRTLAALEVAANRLSKISVTRIGERGANQIGDLLYGSESDQAFALDLLAQAHAANISYYDGCYEDLILAKAKSTNKTLRERIGLAVHEIEQRNPTQVLPNSLTTVLARIRSGEAPAIALSSQDAVFHFKNDDMSKLTLAAAATLSESGDEESAIQLLSAGAKYLGSDLKTSAWAGFLLGDKLQAGRALFAYGLAPDRHPFVARIERFHAVELACRLLYELHVHAARQELQRQSDAYGDAGFDSEAARIREWLAAFEGFESYIKARLNKYDEPVEDPDELRISQRQIAVWHYLRAILGNDRSEIVTGVEWFEKSAIGNSAPWIEGERLLLYVATSSFDIFLKSESARDSTIQELEMKLLRASHLVRSDYPLAISLALRGLSRKALEDPRGIRDLSLAVRMLEPKTPELRHLRELIEEARWDATMQCTGQSKPSQSENDNWNEVLKVVPLLTSVASENNRIKDHFAPYRDLFRRQTSTTRLEMIRALSDRNQRGLALEEVVVDMIESSPSLQVLDVRHRNSYEEIDIIVSCSTDELMLSYWGPVFIIECKNWDDKVGTDPVRAFYTKMTTKKGAVRLGVIISASGFTKGVREITRLFQEALVVTLTLDDLVPVVKGQSTFVNVLRTAIPTALFA